MSAHRHQHKLMIEVVLPKEDLRLRGIGSEAHIACQTIAGTEYVSAILALENDLALTLINHTETGQRTAVCGIGIVEQTMFQRNHRLASSKVDHTHGLVEGDVRTAISLRLLDGKIVELGIAVFLALIVEGEEGMTRALEGDELIR